MSETSSLSIEELYTKKRKREQSDLAKIMGQPEGRRLVWRILSEAGVYALSFAGMDHAQTAFNEGKRSVGNLLLKDISPEVELTMKREAANDKLLHEMELKEKSNG